MMRAIIRTLAFLAFGLVAAGTPSLAAPQPASASSVVKTFYDNLLDTMKQGEKLGFEGRFKKLEPAVKTAFNLPLMARFSAGPAWQTAQPDAQQKLLDAFTTFSVANYASQFKKFDGEKFEVIGEKPATGGGMIVETRLIPNGEAPVTLNYLVKADEKGQMRIVDVLLDASISQLATRRSEFTSIIKREGFDALISSITEKNRKMGVS